MARYAPLPATTKLSRHHIVARVFRDRVGLTGEERFVDLEVVLLEDFAVDDDLISGTDLDDIVEHDLAGQQRRGTGFPAHQRFCLPDDGQLVQCLLGAQLLNDADGAIGDDQQPERAIDHRAGGQHDDEQHTQDGVDTGEDVGPDDVGHAACRTGRHVVGLTVGYPLGDLGISQPADD